MGFPGNPRGPGAGGLFKPAPLKTPFWPQLSFSEISDGILYVLGSLGPPRRPHFMGPSRGSSEPSECQKIWCVLSVGRFVLPLTAACSCVSAPRQPSHFCQRPPARGEVGRLRLEEDRVVPEAGASPALPAEKISKIEGL